MKRATRHAGFTLIELVVVIAIAGILAGMVAVFIKAPVDGYFDTVRRAVLTEEADSALRFVARDLQSALPNSIDNDDALSCSANALRFLSIRSGGRFRETQTSSGTGAPLSFGAAVTGFDTIGGAATSTLSDAHGNAVTGSTSRVVVGNLSSGVTSCHNTVSSAGASTFVNNAPSLTSLASGAATIASATYPSECNLSSATVQDDASTSSLNETNNREFGRFYVVDSTPVTYLCDTAHGLTRNGVSLVDASHVSACQVACDRSTTKARVQLVTFNLSLKDRANETVTLLRRVTIVNRP